MTEDMVNDIHDLLDRERETLLRGDFDTLERLIAQKEMLIDRLTQTTIGSLEESENLRKKISRNQNLLGSAMSGIQDVSNRMNELERARNSLETYDSFGQKRAINTRTVTSVEHRA